MPTVTSYQFSYRGYDVLLSSEDGATPTFVAKLIDEDIDLPECTKAFESAQDARIEIDELLDADRRAR